MSEQAKFGDWVPDKPEEPRVVGMQASAGNQEQPMRARHEVCILLGYLEATNPNHPDLSLLRWLLQDHKAGVPSSDAGLIEANKDLGRMVIDQAQEIAALKEKLARFVTPPQRMDR